MAGSSDRSRSCWLIAIFWRSSPNCLRLARWLPMQCQIPASREFANRNPQSCKVYIRKNLICPVLQEGLLRISLEFGQGKFPQRAGKIPAQRRENLGPEQGNSFFQTG